MPRKLQIEALKAQLSATRALLEKAVAYEDPIAQFQLKKRVASIENDIRDLGTIPENHANVALFFGGEPVFGSVGIDARFAGLALEQFQEIVSKDFAADQGTLGGHGPVPFQNSSKLMVTNTTRGSFGFVLEEASDNTEMVATTLKNKVQDATNLIKNIGSSADADFESSMARIDKRMLVALKKFFGTLDSGHATMRVVEGDEDFTLDKESIHRGRLRIDSTEIEEDSHRIAAIVHGFMPQHKSFEALLPEGNIISGGVEGEAVEQWAEFIARGQHIIGQTWELEVFERVVTPLKGEPRKVYRLLRFLNPKSPEAT